MCDITAPLRGAQNDGTSGLRLHSHKLTLCRLMTYIYIYICRTAPLTFRCCILLIYSKIYVLNILNMLHNLRFFHFNMPFIS